MANPLPRDDNRVPVQGLADSIASAPKAWSGLALGGIEAGTVAIVDGSGAQITSFGGGNQYAVDAPAGPTDIGTLALLVRDDALSTLTPADGDYTQGRTNARGAQWVKLDGSSAIESNVSEQTGLSAGSLNADLVPSTDVSTFRSWSLQVLGSWNGTLSFQGSNDNSNWISVQASNLGYSTSDQLLSNAAAGNTIYSGTIGFKYLRVRMTSYSSGTATGTLQLFTIPNPNHYMGVGAAQYGTWNVGASTGTGGSVPGNAFYNGLIAKTSNPSAATDGNLVGSLSDKLGKQVVVGSIRDLKISQTTTITTSTAETTVLTAVASTFLDVYGVILANSSVTATNVTFKDSTTGTTQFTIYVPAGDTRGFMLPESAAFKQTTVNNNWTATSSASITSLFVTVLAVKNI